MTMITIHPASPTGRGDILFEREGKDYRSRHRKKPEDLGGTPVFLGTRVLLQLLFDSLERGHTLQEFPEEYPTVSREMAIAALKQAEELLSAKA